MKRISLFILLFSAIVSCASLYAQEFRGVNFGITIDNGKGRTQYLVAGIREGASKGIDPALEESELPPIPPVEIFDARFNSFGGAQLGLGSWNDFRPIADTTGVAFTERYQINYQAGDGASSVKITWNTPLPSRVTLIKIDNQDISSLTEIVTQSNSGLITVEITFSYKPLSFKASPSPLNISVDNRQPLPTVGLEIIPEGDTDASWQLTPSEACMAVEPATGSGRYTVDVSIVTSLLAPGSYTGFINVNSPRYPASLEVPVNLTVTLGIDEIAAANGMKLLPNYPNPFSGATQISFELPNATEPASLRIYDLVGKEVMNLSARVASSPGRQTVQLDGSTLPVGVYTCTLRQGAFALSRQITVQR